MQLALGVDGGVVVVGGVVVGRWVGAFVNCAAEYVAMKQPKIRTLITPMSANFSTVAICSW